MISAEELQTRFQAIQNEIHGLSDETVTLVAVSKTFPPGVFDLCVEAGIKHIGENRIQELRDKTALKPQARKELYIHFIGSLQSNKAKYLGGVADSFDALSSLEVLEKINARWKEPKPLAVLLQINSTTEEQKAGLPIDDYPAIREFARECLRTPAVQLEGLMTMGPTPSGNETIDDLSYREATQRAFLKSADLKKRLCDDLGVALPRLSMGMSHDYRLAVECGSTEVRIGSALFGARDYANQK